MTCWRKEEVEGEVSTHGNGDAGPTQAVVVKMRDHHDAQEVANICLQSMVVGP